jgi:cellulose synthase/poly-beta-1,6-N-acetylglucosamine synthase-like glycosyltransferase
MGFCMSVLLNIPVAFAQRQAPSPAPANVRVPLGLRLLIDGVVAPHAMVQALSGPGRLTDELLGRGLVDQTAFYKAMARHHGIGLADLATTPPDARLVDQFGALDCLRFGVLPWCSAGGVTAIATADPGDFARQIDRLTFLFGPVVPALAPPGALEAAVLRLRGHDLARASETTVPDSESCRVWTTTTSARLAMACMTTAFAIALWPQTGLAVLLGLTLVMFAATFALKAAALWVALRPTPPEPGPAPVIARLPTVSMIVALYREADIAPRLIARLGRLDYPRALLDVVLVVEEGDLATRAALSSANLPGWMRVVTAPEGQVKTKPRALNHALGFCRGSIVGVYDAEDAPEPDQIRRVVEHFHRRGPQVACLQGMLDFYNPATNWLSRCFTVEYASWFRVMLPGLQRLGVPPPLGGTTLFFRRDVLQSLGGWDAHNVTEDADLGIRLARHGYRTEMVETTTYEEANCRVVPWIKQRSRWIKGYMMTYASHMRDPVLLWRQLGPRQFWGFQVLFLASIIQIVLAPLTMSLWALALGLGHPVASLIPWGGVVAISVTFLAGEALSLTVSLVGLRKSGHKISKFWVPTLHVYNPLGALASYKALWEMMHKPFYWDKTSHGHFDH